MKINQKNLTSSFKELNYTYTKIERNKNIINRRISTTEPTSK